MSNKFLKGVELNEGADYGYFIPNLTGEGAPINSTEGAIGSLYMDTNTGNIYKCISDEGGVYTWKNITAPLIVTLSDRGDGRVSHSAREICDHAKGGGAVFLKTGEYDYHPLSSYNDDSENLSAEFVYMSDDKFFTHWLIDHEGGLYETEQELVSFDQISERNFIVTVTDGKPNHWASTIKDYFSEGYTMWLKPYENEPTLVPLVTVFDDSVLFQQITDDRFMNIWYVNEEGDVDYVDGGKLVSSATLEETVDNIETEIVDKLCPSFEESGGVVTCEPVEGYPLTVVASEGSTQIVRCGKNLLDFNQDPGEIHFENASGVDTLKYGYEIHLPAGTYTVHAKAIGEGISNESHIFCFLNDAAGKYIALADHLVNNNGTTNTWIRQGPASSCTARTFTFDREVIFYVYQGGIGTTVESATQRLKREHNIQIEAGSVKTDYEPFFGETFAIDAKIQALKGVNTLYADNGEITVSGKADPVRIIEKLTNAILATGGNV